MSEEFMDSFRSFEAGVLKRIRRAAGARIRLSWFKKTKGASRPVKARTVPSLSLLSVLLNAACLKRDSFAKGDQETRLKA